MKKTLKSILFIALTTMVLIGGTLWFIHVYTKHSQELVKVPQIEGLRIDKAIRVLEKGGFRYEITDTVFRDGILLLSIVDQIPDADFEVKSGRKIYLVLNADQVPDVEMPDLAGKTSFTQAERILKNRGVTVGRKIEIQMSEIKDSDSEPVLEQRFAGRNESIPKGTKIKRNSAVDLVVGVMIKTDPLEEDGIVDDPESAPE
ncbi:MAG: beta-lactam-binding protein with PASTA domain [Bacteroidia bacterium]|jgi:beta-lactam-binding protein with PASTA domain